MQDPLESGCQSEFLLLIITVYGMSWLHRLKAWMGSLKTQVLYNVQRRRRTGSCKQVSPTKDSANGQRSVDVTAHGLSGGGCSKPCAALLVYHLRCELAMWERFVQAFPLYSLYFYYSVSRINGKIIVMHMHFLKKILCFSSKIHAA